MTKTSRPELETQTPFFLRPAFNELVEDALESHLTTGGQRLTVGPINLLNVRLERAPVDPSYERMYYTVILGQKSSIHSHLLLKKTAKLIIPVSTNGHWI